MEEAFLVCNNKDCSLYHVTEQTKCPRCGSEKLKCSYSGGSVNHSNVALCESCQRYCNTLQDFEKCSVCNSERSFLKKIDLK